MFLFWWWQRRIDRMKRCSTPDELVKRCGKPAHRIDSPGVCVWHYPLRVIDGTLFSIHVAVDNGNHMQVYLAMEPTTA